VLLFVSMVVPGAVLILAATVPVSRSLPRPGLFGHLLVGTMFVALFTLGTIVGAAGFLFVARYVVSRAELEMCFVRPGLSVISRLFAALFRALCPQPRV
jgi:hypothetical protein